MFRKKLIFYIAIALALSTIVSCSDNVNPVSKAITGGSKMARKEYDNYINNLENLPITFTYGEKDYCGFGSDFKEKSRDIVKESRKESTLIVLEHNESGMEIKVDAAIYPNYGAYEWTVYFTNKSNTNTANLKDICGADINFEGINPVLKGIGGDQGSLYAPYEKDLTKSPADYISESGRPTHGSSPYFNLEHGDGGIIIAIGWSGCWQAHFSNKGNQTHFTGGLNKFNAYLEPGETVRTPLMAFVRYDVRDENIAMNLWRRWFIDCNMRTINDGLFEPSLSGCTATMTSEMVTATEQNQMNYMDMFVNNGINLDFWWMDAGWYYGDNNAKITSWWNTGAWKIDTNRFPTEFAAVTEHAKENGIKTLLWFEPEYFRLNLKKFLVNNPEFKEEWLIKDDRAWTKTDNPWYLVNMGNEEYRTWLLNKVTYVINKSGISLYRQDFNADPAQSWVFADKEGRSGITENLYVQGYLAYWDSLISLYPNMMIDSCASGGGRNDLETMRRSVPLHKTDFDYSNFEIKQSMHIGLFKWLPYFGTVINNSVKTPDAIDKYGLRSSYSAWLNLAYNTKLKKGLDWDLLKQCCDEWESIKEFYYADYYPLTNWSKTDTVWRGWEFYDPDKKAGFIQLFRPENCTLSEDMIKLYGLNPDTTYKLTDMDGNCSTTATGSELINNGFKVIMPEARSSALILIQAV